MKKYKRIITILLVIIIVSAYSIFLNLYNKIDRFDDLRISDMEYNFSNTPVVTKININEASQEELQGIKYIGEGRAKKIIEKRNELGEFTSYEQLLLIDGIGEGILNKIRKDIVIE